MVYKAAPKPSRPDTNIKRISGVTPASLLRKRTTSADIAPPPEIITEPPRPAAVPARRELIDIMPALAEGITMPLPMPIKAVQPKNASG